MKQLPTSFRKDGFDFTMLKRTGDIALFQKDKPLHRSFEVVKVQRHNGFKMAGFVAEPAETMPPSESWGVKGWTDSTLDLAEKRFDKLVKSNP